MKLWQATLQSVFPAGNPILFATDDEAVAKEVTVTLLVAHMMMHQQKIGHCGVDLWEMEEDVDLDPDAVILYEKTNRWKFMWHLRVIEHVGGRWSAYWSTETE